MDAFTLANVICGRTCYEPISLGLSGEAVPVAGGFLRILPTHSLATLPRGIDTLLIPGGPAAAEAAEDPALIAALRALAPRCTRVASICTGAFLLCAAGLVDGKKVATHWAHASMLQARFPNVQVDGDSVFHRNGGVWSSGGMTAGFDLALALIEADLGRPVALAVARQLSLYLVRSASHAQFSPQLRAQHVDDPVIERVQQIILDNLESPLTVADLATRSRLSARSLQRAFPAQVGMTISAFILASRLQKARHLLSDTSHTLKEIAQTTGLGTPANLRRLFLRHLGVSPGAYRVGEGASDP